MTAEQDRLELERLRAEVAELRAHLAQLVQDVHRATDRVDLTMRGQLRCRACGCRRIAHAMSILDRSDSGRAPLAMYQPSVWRSKVVGELEAYACTQCGFTELYVKDAAGLEEHEEHMRILDGSTPESPYR